MPPASSSDLPLHFNKACSASIPFPCPCRFEGWGLWLPKRGSTQDLPCGSPVLVPAAKQRNFVDVSPLLKKRRFPFALSSTLDFCLGRQRETFVDILGPTGIANVDICFPSWYPNWMGKGIGMNTTHEISITCPGHLK